MGKRWQGEWNYYKIKRTGEPTHVRFRPKYDVKYYEMDGYTVEQLKPRRYTIDEIKWAVKRVLVNADQPVGTKDLWKLCLDEGILLSDKVFLKKLNTLANECEWLENDWVGNGKTWRIRKPKISIYNDSQGDYKWNDNWDTIMNVRTNKNYPLRNSGAVRLVVHELNRKDNEIKWLKEHISQLENDYSKTIISLQEQIIRLNGDE